MLQEFKEFMLRGNVIDLAIAVVIGAAFKTVVDTFVSGLITPLIAAFGGQPDFSALDFTINDSSFMYGVFLNAVIAFIIVGAVLFFLVIKPVNELIKRSRKEPPADPTVKKCSECLSEIPIDARRCAFCTSQQAA